MVNIKINGKEYQVEEGITVLEAARKANIDIPTLCYLKDINEIGACRICLVEVKGARAYQASCVYPVAEGLEIFTNTPGVRKARKVNLELILSNHDRNCLTCIRSGNCELQKLAENMQVSEVSYIGDNPEHEIDDTSLSIVRNNNKCVLCRRCVSVCKNVQTVSVIDALERGFDTAIGCAGHMDLADTPCVNCGQCIIACPVGALYEKSNLDDVYKAMEDESKHVVVQVAPAVRAAIGEEFGFPIGTRVTGKLAASLKELGFDGVFDTDTAADVTIMEEGTELIQRLKEGKNLPIITSCSPGWVKFCEHEFPEFLDNLSTAKSPHEMFGAILKTYYAEKKGIDPKDIFVVSIMPCTAKKFESAREELANKGLTDVDVVLTTRELARMIKEANIDFANLEDQPFDMPFGEASGAGVIFGATGGVMEAAVRTAADILTGKSLDKLEYKEIRGIEGIKEAEIPIGDITLKIAIANGLANARELLNRVKSGEADYHFIEIMACPGGCVNGGGQPIQNSKVKMDVDLRSERAKALYEEDEAMTIRKSHENPIVIKLYEEFFGEPCGHKSHELLHTHYKQRENY